MRYKIKQWLVIVTFWLLIGLFFSIYDLIVFDYSASQYVVFLPDSTTVYNHIMLSLVAPFLGGLFGASFIVFYLRDKFKKFSYGKLLLLHGATYMALILLVAFLVIFINSSILLKNTPWSDEVILRGMGLMTDYGIWKVVAFWFVIVILTVFLLEVNDKYGPGVLKKLILGSYYHPQQEFRVFMFLDLRESTALAEKIGSKQYFLLLQQFFKDITEPILNSRGEIYQYVGDEITVSWQQTIIKNRPACIDCYLAIKTLIDNKKDVYINQFGDYPKFKVGIHCGTVTVGEIGIIKKEIVYSGDVLNTAARLMEACKEFGTEVLISEDLYQKLGDSYAFDYVSDKQLRGKSKPIKLYTYLKVSEHIESLSVL
ncbi:adenylate/guanylate cyclase domain-containing protein [Fulvivirga aurantia]|uniref:adenylate/guanylate cyclase domain-containing protein n=1 Tax=Fulvivirga aurantia TaxID=2529383 RepID=UPI0012BBE81F|nr:adenylate/guanylate cyclase domain-containing protein [Fulvivirga aurantia]